MRIEAPLALHREPVRLEWIDYNGHMNVAYYTLIFDHAVDAFLDFLGTGEDYAKRTQCSFFTLDARILYLRELTAGQFVRCTIQLLDYDEKRFHYCAEMTNVAEGWSAALGEAVSIHVDLTSRQAAPMPGPVIDLLKRIKEAHAVLEKPPMLDRPMGIGRDQRA